MSKLNADFLLELFKWCLKSKDVADIASLHLKYGHLPSDPYKKLWKAIVSFIHANDQLPTIGILGQQFQTNKEVTELIGNMKEVHLPEKDAIINQLQDYIRSAMFVKTFDEAADVYNKGDKDQAYEMMSDLANDLTLNLNLQQEFFVKIFAGYQDRHITRVRREKDTGNLKRRVPTGIDELDAILMGGLRLGDIHLFLGQSGAGKSTLLRHLGVSAARRGFKVLHISQEDTEEANTVMYDAAWTGVFPHDLEFGKVSEATNKKIKTAVKTITDEGGEIYFKAYEKFDASTLKDVDNDILEIRKIIGEEEALLVLLDYFELFDPGDGIKYRPSEEIPRLTALGKKLKNIAVMRNVAIATPTQASTVNPSDLNTPDFVMTRYNISDFKGVIRPFQLFITLNQTDTEYEDGIMRLYIDKANKVKKNKLIHIYQSYEHGKFYDKKRTLNTFYDAQNIDNEAR